MSDDPNPNPTPDPDPDPTPDPEPRSFSQDDVDRIVKERLARAKSTPPADYEELKAAKAKLDELEEANRSEQEKAQKRAEEAEARAEKIEADLRETRLRAALVAEAAKPDRKVVDIDAAIALLDRNELTLDDEGNPTNVAEAMDSLLEARPFLVAGKGGSRGNPADQGARGGGANQLDADAVKNMSPEEIAKAYDEGRLANYMGSSA